jgi:hypothetical protein
MFYKCFKITIFTSCEALLTIYFKAAVYKSFFIIILIFIIIIITIKPMCYINRTKHTARPWG